jgi:hypothetical protein
MQVELSNEQFGLLKRVADLALTELKVEVRRTSIREYHDELKREEEQLKEIVARLDEVVAH